MLSRKEFFRSAIGLAGLGLLTPTGKAFSSSTHLQEDPLPTWKYPDLSLSIKNPVKIRSVELLKTQGELLLVVTSEEGVKGITQCNDRMQNLVSLLKGLVIPHFVGKDARDVAQLAENAYRLNSNYKYAGMPLWNCIGSVEIAVWDLLGRTADKPVYALLGQKLRSSYEVYLSSFDRESAPEKVLEDLKRKLSETSVKGVKIKIGGRLRNTPEDDARSTKLLNLARKVLGDDVTIYADANGSFDVKDGIKFGKMLEDIGADIYEEPLNFEDEDGMRQVTKALKRIKVAGGEQDTSLYRFQRLAKTRVYDILQPDVYYNGGILRTLQVAEIARQAGIHIAPHTPKADPLAAPFWQVAAVCPVLYGLQEYPISFKSIQPDWYTPYVLLDDEGKMVIPDIPGLGIEYDGDIWKTAEKVV
mgnify:CR=1 FL=1